MTRHCTTLLFLALSLGGVGWAAPSMAQQNCGDDLQKLAERRQAELEMINGLVKSAHGKQLDPTVFCAKSAGLNAAETAMIAYMEKNKDWCSFPDDAISQLKEHHIKNASFNAKACTVAAQIRKMKEKAAQGGGDAPQAMRMQQVMRDRVQQADRPHRSDPMNQHPPEPTVLDAAGEAGALGGELCDCLLNVVADE